MHVSPAIAERIRRANVEVHRREAPLYDALHSEIFGPRLQRAIEQDLDVMCAAHAAVAPAGSRRALDLGCGTGNLTLKLVERGYRVSAADLSAEMIDVLRTKLTPAQAERVRLVVGDAEQLLEDTADEGPWDVITISAVLHHLPDYEVVLRRAFARLAPHGVLYVCHEPLPPRESSRGGWARAAHVLCDWLDKLFVRTRVVAVYAVRSWRAGTRLARIDYTWSDYHVRAGLDADALVAALEQDGARTLRDVRYRSYYSSVVAALASRLGATDPDHFRFIVQHDDTRRGARA